MGTVPVFASAAGAMQMVRAGLDYLAAADATAMPAEEQARCLRGLEQVNSVATAARTCILGAYTAGQGYAADADYSPRAWHPQDRRHQGRRRRVHRVDPAVAGAPAGRAGAGGRGDPGVGGADVVPVDGQAAAGAA